MAKLNKKKAGEAENTENAFEVIDACVTHARLMNVDTSKSGQAGPYWSWEFQGVEDGPALNRRFWNNTTLAEGKMFGLKMTFDAFGVPTDTDTDDLCGRIVKLTIGVRTIQSGSREGELANSITKISKADPDFKMASGSKQASPEPEDVFG